MNTKGISDIFPEFHTPQWIIRKFKLTDLNLVEKASEDPLIPLITSIPEVFSKKTAQDYIKRQWARYDEATGYSFAIAQTDMDQAIGSIFLGLHNIKEGRASLGYWVLKDFRGEGAAKTALKEVVY